VQFLTKSQLPFLWKWKAEPKIEMALSLALNSQNNLKEKNKVGECIFLELKIYNKVTVISTVQYW
jgi:hypothetical protein